ncbi:hypothetical protein BDY19DRAFT_997724 [Irpex rosettiformis]|uniref:Uncharacterized protein n=1 Tax=Irpex rosettiformis TaxID=378272 RepID=A0ACB8TQV6_9APHY|nr:hypothetical protein BDY19DRAFT_997724 [Irpex rosettiformis]
MAIINVRSKTLAETVAMQIHRDKSARTSDDNLLVLSEVMSKEFEAFLDFISSSLKSKDFSIAELEAVLKLSEMYSAPSRHAFAIKQLDAKSDVVSSAHFLSMLIAHQVHQWFKPNFMSLASNPLHLLSPTDLKFISFTILSELFLTHHVLELARRNLVRIKPAIYHQAMAADDCISNDCIRICLALWDTVAEPMLLSETWHTPRKILKRLLNQF